MTNVIDTDKKPQILVVEDDASLSEWICDYLITQDYEVILANRGDEAIALIRNDNPDLVILDIMLPGKDGLDVCREARTFYKKPVLMLTARTEEIDEVLGLETGADDYLIKPVKPRVLLARIKALLRRSNPDSLQTIKSFGELTIDISSRTVKLSGEIIILSSTGFDALLLLSENAGEIVSRDKFMQSLRGLEYDGVNRSIDLLISRLRRKLGDDPDNPTRIKTIRGKGYLFAVDAW